MIRDAANLRRRSFAIPWKTLGIILLAGTAVVGYFALRITTVTMEQEQRRGAIQHPPQLWDDPLLLPPEGPIAPPVPVGEPEPERYDVVEYVLEVGEERIEVDRPRVTLPGNVPVRLTPSGNHTWTSERFSFRHAADLRVASEQDEEGRWRVTAIAPGDVRLSILELAAEADPAEYVADYASEMSRSVGAEPAGAPALRRIGDETSAGVHLTTAGGLSFEAHGVLLAPGLPLGIVISGGDPASPSQPVEWALRFLSPEAREPGGVVDLGYLGERHPLPLDVPTTVSALPGAPEITVRRREAVLRRFVGLTFEHSQDLLPSPVDDGMVPRLILTTGTVNITFVSAEHMAPDEILLLLGAALEGRARPAQREIIGQQREGRQLDSLVGGHRVHSELHAFPVTASRSIGLLLQHPRDVRDEAERLFAQVAASIR